MRLEVKKHLLIHQILQINDELLLETVKNLLDFGLKHQNVTDAEAVTDFWKELTDMQKQRVEQAIQQMKNGQGIPHQTVMTNYRKKYNRS